MSELKMTGVVTKILQEESGTSKAGKDWTKGGFVINNGNEYNPDTCFGVFGSDKLKDIITFAEGQEVEVDFNLSSREHNGKYYTQADEIGRASCRERV